MITCTYNRNTDGIDHINVDSRGRTASGQYLYKNVVEPYLHLTQDGNNKPKWSARLLTIPRVIEILQLTKLPIISYHNMANGSYWPISESQSEIINLLQQKQRELQNEQD